ncbi:monovalent cation/H(+) antiporter subunit G [Parvibaculum sp.]|uniref:monovalent cation/H(+) antiporter subunit G n=1 Tax=Parvibaculum sp. TaxID=2024848 RepID=UPI00391A693F
MDPALIELARDLATAIAFLVGGGFILVGSLGLIRLPDIWARFHAAGIIDTIGAELILIGMMFQTGLTQTTLKLMLIGLFLFVTGPTATHAVANAAFIAGIKPQRLKRNEAETVLGDDTPEGMKA